MSAYRRMVHFVKKIVYKSYFTRFVFEKLRFYKNRRYYRRKCMSLPTDEKLILFESFFGREYADSPRAIYEELLRNADYDSFRFVWIFKKPDEMIGPFINHRTTILAFNSKERWKAFGRAKYWVLNSRLEDYMEKKEDQVFIETWHGTPLKRLGFDIKHSANIARKKDQLQKMYFENAKKFSYFISPSKFCTEVFATAFGLDKLNKKDILIETGYPRNDDLFRLTEEKKQSLKEELGVPKDKTIILYAPTWRDNQHQLGVGYTFDAVEMINEMIDRLPDNCFLIVRLHYFIATQLDLTKRADRAVDFSNLRDINDLYSISDILITDYSSVFFDYANLKRPILFYMYDLEEYRDQIRDFYIDLEELPGPILKTQEELSDALNRIDEIEVAYRERYFAFREKYNYLDDENASLRVIQRCISTPSEKGLK